METNDTARTLATSGMVSPPFPSEGMISAMTDEEIAIRAYCLWEDRGRPFGSPDEDWFKAVEELRANMR